MLDIHKAGSHLNPAAFDLLRGFFVVVVEFLMVILRQEALGTYWCSLFACLITEGSPGMLCEHVQFLCLDRAFSRR